MTTHTRASSCCVIMALHDVSEEDQASDILCLFTGGFPPTLPSTDTVAAVAGPSTPNPSQPHTGSTPVKEAPPAGRRKVLVRFLGDSSHAWVWKDELKDFTKHQTAITGGQAERKLKLPVVQ